MRALYVISQKGFRDEEYLVPKKILEDEGFDVTTASNVGGKCSGALGAKVTADIALSDVDPDEFDVLVVAGGPGTPQHLWPNTDLQEIVKQMNSKQKIVAAICLAPVVLARAGILRGRKAAVYESPDSIVEMEKGHAIHVSEDVVVDDNLITANGPDSAEKFGLTIVETSS